MCCILFVWVCVCCCYGYKEKMLIRNKWQARNERVCLENETQKSGMMQVDPSLWKYDVNMDAVFAHWLEQFYFINLYCLSQLWCADYSVVIKSKWCIHFLSNPNSKELLVLFILWWFGGGGRLWNSFDFLGGHIITEFENSCHNQF